MEFGPNDAVRLARLPAMLVPLVVASPHSGAAYPERFLAQSVLDLVALRHTEDAFVDLLFGAAPSLGAPLLAARFPRTYLDANREAGEMDPAMFEGPLPDGLTPRTVPLAAGLGAIPRVAASGEAIYGGRLPAEEIERRLASCWRPYHTVLAQLCDEAAAEFGGVLLIDAHSMPSAAAGVGRGGRVDVVLGDNHGAACAPALMGALESWLRRQGLRVRRNQPYAGGYTTQRYGRPGAGRHAVQIELNRALYMDERQMMPTADFEPLAELMTAFLREAGRLATDLVVPRALAAE